MRRMLTALVITTAVLYAVTANATVVKPVGVTSSIVGDAGSNVDYLLSDNVGLAALGLQRPLGNLVPLDSGAPLQDALDTFAFRGDAGHMESWTANTTEGNPVFSFDLGGDTSIGSILLWQYGNTGGSTPAVENNGNDTREFDVIFHTQAEGSTFDFSTETIDFSGTMAVTELPDDTSANGAQFFGFSSVETAGYVGLRIASNYLGQSGITAGGDRYGLGEVRFATEITIEPPAPVILTLEINRDDGTVAIRNDSNSPINISGLDITSAAGSLDPIHWKSIAGNYDIDGDESVSSDMWSRLSATSGNLAEVTLGSGTIAAATSVQLDANAAGLGAWLMSPTEDVRFEYNNIKADGTVETVSTEVDFVGTSQTTPYAVGDLNFDGQIDQLDWPVYRDGYSEDLSALSRVEAYQKGDLNEDGVNDNVDFRLFKELYEANNPGMSFEAMVASVPEPSSLALITLGLAGCVLGRLRPWPYSERQMSLLDDVPLGGYPPVRQAYRLITV